jgi:hypothetical protein
MISESTKDWDQTSQDCSLDPESLGRAGRGQHRAVQDRHGRHLRDRAHPGAGLGAVLPRATQLATPDVGFTVPTATFLHRLEAAGNKAACNRVAAIIKEGTSPAW